MLTREENKALKVPAEMSGVSVNVGEDGAWLCFSTSNGKSYCFQPITALRNGADGVSDIAIKSWCIDMQILYESAEIFTEEQDLDATT